MTNERINRLQRVRSLEELSEYLREELGWPIEGWDLEKVTFDWTQDMTDLDPAVGVKINSVRQLRSFTVRQPWGIFFIDFQAASLPITVLRRMLRALVFKERGGVAGRPSWMSDDLLFVSALGPEDDRSINLAHFSRDTSSGQSILRVVDWDEADSHFHMLRTDSELQQLKWKLPDEDTSAWQERWRSAFSVAPFQVGRDSKKLAAAMATLAKRIRAKVLDAFAIEPSNGTLHELYAAYQAALIHDAKLGDFADMYAQTITYGLFAAKKSRPMGITAENAKDLVEKTNPFLAELLAQFTQVSGRTQHLDFDELGVDALVQLLNDIDLEVILADWGRAKPGEDPVIHFYEDFLHEYNRVQKVQRGVFYTPKPVVSFIVRSVHDLLKDEFQLPDGLASTETWGDMAAKFPELKIPEGAGIATPFVQVLDPACGTGTFLVEVIEVIHETMKAKWAAEGIRHGSFEWQQRWNDYVPNHLLKRIYGFELMMASYTIAHMKVGLKLGELGYKFAAAERLRIYLTNTLEPPQDFRGMFDIMAPALAHEAHAVNEVKANTRFTVVVGNPPYSRSSANAGRFITTLMESYKRDVQSFRNIQPLSDDYIKFWRITQYHIDRAGVGVAGLITNDSFLSGTVHRGMRRALLQSFSDIRVLELHGSLKVHLRNGQSGPDENVFAIQQGVAITLLCNAPASRTPPVRHVSFVGDQASKYQRLSAGTVSVAVAAELAPVAPNFLWVPYDGSLDVEYAAFLELPSLFHFHSVGGKPGDDGLLVSFEAGGVLSKLQDAAAGRVPARTEAAAKLAGRARTVEFDPAKIEPYAYRPFDVRWVYYDPMIWTRAVSALHERVKGQPVLLASKIVKDADFAHAFVANIFPDVIHLSATSSVNCYAFPSGPAGDDSPMVETFAGALGRSVVEKEAFGWVYAILHSPAYRARYGEQLRYDFPRIPMPRDGRIFDALSAFGSALVGTHLLEAPAVAADMSLSSASQLPTIASGFPRWANRAVELSGGLALGPVPASVWQFRVGGYQPAQKWLKDRRGRILTDEDIEHYKRIIGAITETIRIQKEIDEVIEAHGGWPAAFQGGEGE